MTTEATTRHQGGDHRDPQHPVGIRAHRGGQTPHDSARRADRGPDPPPSSSLTAATPASVSSSGVPRTVTRSPTVTVWSRPGTGHGGRSVGRNHGHRGQGAEEGPQRRKPFDLDLRGHEPGPGQFDLVRVAAQAGLDDGGGGQTGHVEHGAGPGDLGDGGAHGGIGQLHDDPYLGSQLADQQGGLEGLDLGALGADHGPGRRQPGLLEDASDPGAAHDEGDVPGLDHPHQARFGLVVDHHHAHAGLVELLDHPQAHALEAADDHVALQVPAGGTIHPDMVPDLHFLRIAGVFPLGTGVGSTRAGRAERGIHVRLIC